MEERIILEIHACKNCGASIGLKEKWRPMYTVRCVKCGHDNQITPHTRKEEV